MPFARLGGPESPNPRPWDARALSRIGAAAIFLTACGGGTGLLLPGDGEATHISIVGGNNQSGRVGEPLQDPLVVEVTDSRGRAVNGASVAFEFTSAGPEASIVPATTTTDTKGEATAQLVLGTTIGPQTGQASVVTQGSQTPSISFTVMAVPKSANGIAAVSGDDQSGAAGSLLRQPLVVQVTDGFGNPISGVRIDWTAEGGGSVSDGSNTTDETGRASVERTLGPTAGRQTTLASSEGLAGSPVTFAHTATAGNASSLSIVSGDNQTAAAGSKLPADLVVRLVDGEGNGVPGTAVAWVVGIGGGSVTPQSGTTDNEGRASAQWTLGPNPGQNRVDAVVSGIGVANFNATGTAGAPAALAILTQPSGSARNGVPFQRQPVIQVRDGQGHDVAASGVLITAQLSGSGGELIGTTQRTTDLNGRASFTDLAISGATGPRTLVFTSASYAGVTSGPIDVSAAATTTTIIRDDPDPSAAGSAFTVEFRVASAGPAPNGTVTVTVSDGSANCTSSIQNGTGSCQLTLGKVGHRTLRATYSGGPGFNGSSGTESHEVVPVQPQNQPPHADYNWHCDGFTCPFTDKSRDSDGNIVSWSWNFGDGTSSTDRNPIHTFPGASTYQVTLTVTDNAGATNSSTAAVAVTPPPPPENKKPHAEFEVACSDLTCSFSDRSTDPDGTIAAWRWDFGDGTPGSDQPNPSHTYAVAGDYQVTLVVTDNSGGQDSKQHGAHPTAPPPPPNQSPTAAFTESCTDLGCSFNSGGSSDPDGTIVGWSWNFGDGTFSTEPNPAHTFSGTGMYTVTLMVTDNAGATNSTAHSVTVTAPPPPPPVNQPPVASFDVPSCTVGVPCAFNDTSTDPDGNGDIVSRVWDYGDGSPTDNNASHTYASPDASGYTVTLTVIDAGGLSSTATHVVPVSPPSGDIRLNR